MAVQDTRLILIYAKNVVSLKDGDRLEYKYFIMTPKQKATELIITIQKHIQTLHLKKYGEYWVCKSGAQIKLKQVQYVHELQNLYFCLVGEEL